MATMTHAEIITRQHTRAQKTQLAHVRDPHKRGELARSLSDMNVTVSRMKQQTKVKQQDATVD